MGRTIRSILAGIVVGLAGLHASHAAIVSGTYTFNATGFTTGAPTDPVHGAVSITFNNSLSYNGQSSGISLVSSNIGLDSTVEFDYFSTPDILVIGGSAAGVMNSDPSSRDFALYIGNASTAPMVTTFTYSAGSGTVYTASTDSVTFAPAASIPEPASLLLLSAGVGMIAVASRRKSTST